MVHSFSSVLWCNTACQADTSGQLASEAPRWVKPAETYTVSEWQCTTTLTCLAHGAAARSPGLGPDMGASR